MSLWQPATLQVTVFSRPWRVPVTLCEQTFQTTLSNARLFIDFSSEGGNALDVIKIISISAPVSASMRGCFTIADWHVQVGSVGCRREASLHLCLVNSFMSKVAILEGRFMWITWIAWQSAGNGGKGGFPSQICEPQTLRGTWIKRCSQKHLVSPLCFL